MAKIRFTDADKWDDKWYRNLSPNEKVVFQFLCDKCDNAGFYELDLEDMEFRTKLTKNNILGAIKGLNRGFEDNPKILESQGILWIRNFLRIQKNLPLSPNNNAHKQIIHLISSKLNLFPDIPEKIGANKGLFSPIGIGTGKGIGKVTGEITDEAQEIMISSFGRNPKPADMEFINKHIQKFGFEKTKKIYREAYHKNFNSLLTLDNALDENGNIKSKNENKALEIKFG